MLTRQQAGISNVGPFDRSLSAIAGAAMVATAAKRRSAGAALLALGGAALLARALTGRSGLYRALGLSTVRDRVNLPVRAEDTITVQASASELYGFWRNFANLPRVMEHLRSVQVQPGGRSHWVARGPGGMDVEWEAEIVNDVPGELIGWRSLPGSDVDHAGSVRFQSARDGVGTRITVVLRYNAGGGGRGAAAARLLGEAPQQQIATDLRRFKQLAESGGLVTSGQRPLVR